jgi:hypothetical protein
MTDLQPINLNIQNQPNQFPWILLVLNLVIGPIGTSNGSFSDTP